MLQWWDRIPLPNTVMFSHETMLCEWFYRPPSRGELLSGDWSMDANFQEHVRCIYMDPNTGIAQVDCRTVSPTRDRFFLFYSEERGHLVIWGGLTCHDLLALRPPGVVRRNEDLLWQPANRTRCRSLATVPVLQEPLLQEQPLKFFQLPVADCADKDQHLTAQVFDVALSRLEWYYDADDGVGKKVPWNQAGGGDPELASFLLCAMLAHAIPQREAALEYQLHRLARERELFDIRMAPFLQSEKAMATLLMKHNPRFWERHFICKLVAPEPEDEQALLRTRNASVSVTLWIRIPFWEAPCVEVAREFPLHPGGFIHLPCHPPWVATWIWESHVLPEAQRHFTTTTTSGKGTTAPSGTPFGDFFQEAILYLPELKERYRRRCQTKKKTRVAKRNG